MPVYDEIWDGPGRNYKKEGGAPMERAKWYVVIHNTSNDASAPDEADYAKVRTDGTGSHYYADKVQVLQSTDTDRCVGHVGSDEGNERGLSYEITGFNSWTREQWLANVAWDDLAAVIARDCLHFDIPARLLTIAQMQSFTPSVKGFVTHDMCRRAWGETTHTDPGPNFPMDHLLGLVKKIIGGTVTQPTVDRAYEVLVNGDRPGFPPSSQTSFDEEHGISVSNTRMWRETQLIHHDVHKILAAVEEGGGGTGVGPAQVRQIVREEVRAALREIGVTVPD